jgi:hypothetical protein
MEFVSERDALVIWARAAQLQAEASADTTLAEVRHAPPAPTAPDVELVPATRAPAGMYLQREVTSAALQAGITPEFIALAIAEHEALGAHAAVVADELSPETRAKLVGHPSTSVRVARVIPESPDVVLSRLRAVAGAAPFHLTFETALGPHPRDGGVLRFAIAGLFTQQSDAAPRGVASWFLYHAARMQVTHAHITLAPRGTAEAPGCELRITVDLRYGQHANSNFFSTASAALAGLFGAAGALIGLSRIGGVLGPVIGGAAGFAAAVGYNAFIAAILRWEHRTAKASITASLERLLANVQRPGDEQRVFGAAVQPRLQRRGGAPMEMVRADLNARAGAAIA